MNNFERIIFSVILIINYLCINTYLYIYYEKTDYVIFVGFLALTIFGLITSIRFSKTKQHAYNDELTGLYNRRFINEVLPRFIGLAKRKNTPLGVSLVDIDELKQINDRYGHKAGDQVIKNIADVFRDNLRSSDIAARIGGDEFLLICPNTDREGINLMLDRLRQALKDEKIDPKYHVEISAGTVIYPEETTNVADIISLSDEKMYLNKRKQKHKSNIRKAPDSANAL